MTKQNKQYLRFSGFRRFQHWINTVSFLTLGFTGLIQKFNQAPFSLFFLEQLGGIESVRIIHRVSAIVLVLVSVVLTMKRPPPGAYPRRQHNPRGSFRASRRHRWERSSTASSSGATRSRTAFSGLRR